MNLGKGVQSHSRRVDTAVCVRALQMCVCVRFRCVCACASDVSVCVLARALQMYAQKTSHTALDCYSNNPERLLCLPCLFGQSLYRVLVCEIERECITTNACIDEHYVKMWIVPK